MGEAMSPIPGDVCDEDCFGKLQNPWLLTNGMAHAGRQQVGRDEDSRGGGESRDRGAAERAATEVVHDVGRESGSQDGTTYPEQAFSGNENDSKGDEPLSEVLPAHAVQAHRQSNEKEPRHDDRQPLHERNDAALAHAVYGATQ
jgi:hypothetical protein